MERGDPLFSDLDGFANAMLNICELEGAQLQPERVAQTTELAERIAADFAVDLTDPKTLKGIVYTLAVLRTLPGWFDGDDLDPANMRDVMVRTVAALGYVSLEFSRRYLERPRPDLRPPDWWMPDETR